jgi:hypothetical protein
MTKDHTGLARLRVHRSAVCTSPVITTRPIGDTASMVPARRESGATHVCTHFGDLEHLGNVNCQELGFLCTYVHMFAMMRDMSSEITQATQLMRNVLNSLEIESMTGIEAGRLVRQVGVLRRLSDAVFAVASLRLADTNVHIGHGARSAADHCAKLAGTGVSEARNAANVARSMRSVPEVASALHSGELSLSNAATILPVANVNPEAAADLIVAAALGATELREACHRARQNVESDAERSTRQRASRTFSLWTTPDGMVAGRFALTPEVGGQVKSVLDRHAQRRFRCGGDPIDQVTADVFAALILHSGQFADSPRLADVSSHASPDFVGNAAPDLQPSQDKIGSASPLENHVDHVANPLEPDQPSLLDTLQGTIDPAVKTTVHVVIDHAALVRGNALPGERCEGRSCQRQLGARAAGRCVCHRCREEGGRHHHGGSLQATHPG